MTVERGHLQDIHRMIAVVVIAHEKNDEEHHPDTIENDAVVCMRLVALNGYVRDRGGEYVLVAVAVAVAGDAGGILG